jgi:hypothetical protein
VAFGPMSEWMNLQLEHLLLSRRWLRHEQPFPHVVGRDVFQREIYDQLSAQFAAIEARGLCERPAETQFGRSLGGYDAYSCGLTQQTGGPLQLFASRPWHDLLSRIMRVPATGEITGGLHFHAAGSADGKVHNDLNPGWFPDQPVPPGKVTLTDTKRWSYFDGRPLDGDLPTRERIRAVAMIFYLANPAWQPGDGGMTGLYSSPRQPVNRPDAAVPPVNNTMLLFECGARSWHSFISNRQPRRSVILWLHRTREDAIARWGEHAIVNWK